MLSPAEYFKCLSEDIRLYACLLLHTEGELCVCELMEALGESQSKISRHLAQLRNCGLLDTERRGQWVYYSISKSNPDWIKELLDVSLGITSPQLNRYRKKLSSMKDRPLCS